ISEGTVGALYRLVLEKLGPNATPRCLGQPVFYQMRRAFGELVGVPEQGVTPSRHPADVRPLRQRPRDRQRLGEALDLSLPGLCRPAWLRRAIHLSSFALLAAGAIAFVAARPAGDATWPVLGLLSATALKHAASYLLTVPCAVCFPPECL